ncbi:MAG: TonB-dependent receptor [Candidatus Eisenbacteria bacterium]|uniref:TonB-dependent receptor n=1 Tax=Eiseniibacteriota bacterium TaxID=2212470 RepID=A0A7Y2H0V0_UNCEI|nr:TonB-dependent receptor [Candidatus Eisenbacteria bacterium]
MAAIQGTHEKALQINLDQSIYGTVAEIGAGQEVARWFFRVGGAAGTIAKALSAYDMTFSDAIYGECERYVSKERLVKMLEKEYVLLERRLQEARGEETKFFAFADTVVARSYSQKSPGHGWLGIRFQSEPMEQPSQIIVHVRLWGEEAVQDQETIGTFGVNFIHSALYHFEDSDQLVGSLIDNLSTDRVEVDMIEFSGPAFQKVDNRLMSLKLVEGGLTSAAMFTADGSVIQPSDHLYKKAILVERGSFRPVTKVSMDMLEATRAQFVQEPSVNSDEIVTIFEMTLSNLSAGDKIDYGDFLERVDMLSELGVTVMISNFLEYHRLAAYFFRHTKKMIAVAMGVPTLQKIFEEQYYEDLEGGILESMGRMFKNDLKLYVYPLLDRESGAVISAGNLRVVPHLRHLYQYLYENQLILGLRDYDEKCLPIFSREVLERIQTGDDQWEYEVPEEVISLIKERRLLGYASRKAA